MMARLKSHNIEVLLPCVFYRPLKNVPLWKSPFISTLNLTIYQYQDSSQKAGLNTYILV